MDKNNFILYKDFKSTIDILSDEQAGKLIKAVFSYVNGRVNPNFDDGMLIVAFNVLKAQLERDLIKYKKIVVRNQENGKKGGRPKNNPDEEHEPKEPNGLNGNPKNPSKPRKADRDSVSDSVSESVSDIKDKHMVVFEDEEILLEHETLFKKFWNAYPKKVSKGTAEKWFTKHKPSEQLVNTMIDNLNIAIQSTKWLEQNGKFIPYPTTWLNAKGWLDEVEIDTKKAMSDYMLDNYKKTGELI